MPNTAIEWTDETWNPIAGCSVHTPGCTNCYAMKMAARLEAIALADVQLADTGALDHYIGLTQPSKAGPVWTGRIGIAPDSTLTKPLRWKKPRRIFVNSMSDLFHPAVPDEVIDRVFAVMALCPQHTFQLLTKRSARMREYVSSLDRAIVKAFAPPHQHPSLDDPHAAFFAVIAPNPIAAWPLPNVWLGVSVEDQTRADERIPDLLATPAAVRFISAEPLLGPVDLTWIAEPDEEKDGVIDALLGCNWIDGMGRGIDYFPTRPGHEGRKMTRCVVSGSEEIVANRKLDWVICGGESGPGARPMDNDWAEALVDQCQAAGVPVFVKQLSSGGTRPIHDIEQFPEGLRVREFPNAR